MYNFVMAKKYCYLLPEFPKEAFVIIPFLAYKEKIDIYPLHKVAVNVNEASEYMLEFVGEITKRLEGSEVPDTCAVLPISHKSLYPLRREFWKKPTAKFGYFERKHLFVNLLANPLIHEIVVTPSQYLRKDKSWELSATLPIKVGTSGKVIESFMMSSDATVNEKASHAAIYTVGKGLKFNWETKKIEPIDFPPTSIDSQN